MISYNGHRRELILRLILRNRYYMSVLWNLSYKMTVLRSSVTKIFGQNFFGRFSAKNYIFWSAVFWLKLPESVFLVFFPDSRCMLLFNYFLFRILPDLVFFFRRFFSSFLVFSRFLPFFVMGVAVFRTAIFRFRSRFFKNGRLVPTKNSFEHAVFLSPVVF